MVVYNSYSTRKDGRVDIGKQANRHVMNYVINKVRDLAVCVFMEIQCAYGQGSFDDEYAYRALLT